MRLLGPVRCCNQPARLKGIETLWLRITAQVFQSCNQPARLKGIETALAALALSTTQVATNQPA